MIDVRRQDERGNELARYMDAAVVSEILGQADPDGRCLAFIDPYGDTTFNQLQLPVLLREMQLVRDQLPDGELRSRADDLMKFLRLALDEVHTYIKFIGD